METLRKGTVRDNLMDSDQESFGSRNCKNIMGPEAHASILEDRHIEKGT